MLFGLTQATAARLLSGREDELMVAARMMERQLNEQFCPAWNLGLCSVTYYSDPNEMIAEAPHAFPLVLFDDPDVAGVLGYHEPRGAKIFVRPSLDAGSQILSGDAAILQCLCHEAFEALTNMRINRWVDMGNGLLTAEETADAVEGDKLVVTLDDGTEGRGSNFLLPQWFDAKDDVGPYDWLGNLSAPFAMTPNGYMIVQTAVPGSERRVFGRDAAQGNGGLRYLFGENVPDWRRRLKLEHGRIARQHQRAA